MIKNRISILCFAVLALTFASCGGETSTASNDSDAGADVAAVTDNNKSGILEPVKWTFGSKKLGNDEFELIMIANLDKGWSIYSQHTSDDGPVPTAFEFESDNFEGLSEVLEKGKKKEGMDPLFGVKVIKFPTGPVTFTRKIKVKDYSKPVAGYLTYMACDDEKCLPPTDVDFSFDLKQ